jgi:hypothetical protein
MLIEVLWDYVFEDCWPFTVMSKSAHDLYYMVEAISDQRVDMVFV